MRQNLDECMPKHNFAILTEAQGSFGPINRKGRVLRGRSPAARQGGEFPVCYQCSPHFMGMEWKLLEAVVREPVYL